MRPLFRHRFPAALGGILVTGLVAGCQAPDVPALQKLACEQAATNLDMQSVAQMDALRKALGVAPGVDPISACKALGADMTPQGTQSKPADKTTGEQTSEESEP
jgi:hypothetical protein